MRFERSPLPPLYDERFEHAACGLGALVRLDGRQTHELVQRATRALRGLEHRGATGADPDTGDGAGIMVQLPDRFLRREFEARFGHGLPEPGGYAAGLVFLPRDPALRLRCEELCVRVCAEEGHRALGFRDVPIDSSAIGPLARSCEPVMRQLFVERRSGDEAEFERKLYVIRRRIERLAAHVGVGDAEFMIVSLSSRRLVYKGLLKATQLERYFPDLVDPRFESALAVVHSRFSTNTLGTWDLAHPFNMLAHNGEINTVRGNASWLAARQPQLRSELLGADLQKLYPILEERWSDSAKLDAALELLVLGGRSLEHALTMLVPPAWNDPSTDLADDVRAMCEYHASVMEPWDGPAAIVASDGLKVVAALDRNGLRPARYVRTADGLVAIASEIGVLDADPAEIVECDRVEPGRLLIADTVSGRLIGSREARRALARSRPYGAWLARHQMHIDDLPMREVAPIEPGERERLLHTFAYTAEQIELVLEPLADGAEPVGSMGDDTPVTALAEETRLLSDHFRQQFAQVTNPPIDPRREALVMSLQTSIGAIGNLLDERAEYCRRVVLPTPVLTRDALERLRGVERSGFSAITLPATYPVAEGAAGLERAVDALCRTASRAAWDGYAIVVLSDRDVDAEHAPIPALLATAAVHSHLVREGARTMCGLVVESGEPRETMHVALLLGYGAAAVCPYLALETLDGDRQQGFVKAVGDGLLKICSKMGISTIQSYRGAQIFEAVGLGPRLIERYFPGTVSRVGGIELADVHETQARRHRAGLGDGRAARARRRVPLPGRRGAAPLEPRRDRGAPAGRARPRPRGLRAVLRAVRRRRHHAAQPARARWPAAAGAARAGRARDRARAPLRDRRDEPRLALERGARDARDRDEPDRRPLEHRRGRRGSGALDPRRQRRPAPLGDQAGRLGPVRRDRRLPGRRRPAPDQGRAGREARRGRPAARPQGRRHHRAAAALDPGRRADLAAAAPRHLLDRGPRPADPRPAHGQPARLDLGQARVGRRGRHDRGRRRQGRGRPHRDRRPRRRHRRLAAVVAQARRRRRGSSAWPRPSRCSRPTACAGGCGCRSTAGCAPPRDVIVGALLGAEEFAFSTAPLVAAGCVMMRVCHLNTCPVGIATQDPELRRRFTGTPDHVVTLLHAPGRGRCGRSSRALGARSLDELVGRADLLEASASTARSGRR